MYTEPDQPIPATVFGICHYFIHFISEVALKKSISIIHYDVLQDLSILYKKIDTGDDCYVVFWLDGVVINDLYIRNYNGNEEDIRLKVADRIAPALLKKYSHKSKVNSSDNPRAGAGLDTGETFLMKEKPGTLVNGSLVAGLSVVVCTRNRSKSLDECLAVLKQQQNYLNEIIVVDNGSSDNETKQVCGKHEVVYYREDRVGLDYARNTGARNAKFDIVAYLDDDVTVHAEWALRLLETFKDETVAAMTGLVLPAELSTRSQQIFEEFWSFNKGYEEKVYTTDFIESNVPPVWEIGAGANMAFRTKFLRKYNYFDERLDAGAAGCSGDSEMWYRILFNGGKIVYNPNAIVYHTHRHEFSDLRKQLYYYMRGHTVAALIQDSYKKSGYQKYVYYSLPRYYLMLFKAGFPAYRHRYSTIWSEFKGIISGIFYYRKVRNIKAETAQW